MKTKNISKKLGLFLTLSVLAFAVVGSSFVVESAYSLDGENKTNVPDNQQESGITLVGSSALEEDD